MNEKENYLRLILDEAYDGQFNMARDEFLFRNSIETQDQNAILRFYWFSEPTLTVGYRTREPARIRTPPKSTDFSVSAESRIKPSRKLTEEDQLLTLTTKLTYVNILTMLTYVNNSSLS